MNLNISNQRASQIIEFIKTLNLETKYQKEFNLQKIEKILLQGEDKKYHK